VLSAERSPATFPVKLSGKPSRESDSHSREGEPHGSLRADPPTTLVVPDHRVLKVGLLRKLIDQAGLGTDEFIELLG
jgi:hypothetical protein